MSSKKARQRQKPESAYARRSPAQARKPFWRRSTLWAGGLGAAVTTGVLINVLTTQAQRVAQSPVPGPASSGMITPHAVPSSRVSARPSPTPSGPPLTVVSEDPLNIGQMIVWVFPNKYLPSTGQLHYMIQDGNEPFRATALNVQGPYWSSYRAVYIGGAGTKTGAFIRVNPRTQKPLN